jgi:hypothetical protein
MKRIVSWKCDCFLKDDLCQLSDSFETNQLPFDTHRGTLNIKQCLTTIKMDTINLHVVAPMNHQLVVAGFPYINFMIKQEPLTMEVTVPTSDHEPIQVVFKNLTVHEYIKTLLERYGRRDDAAHLSEEDKAKSWFLDLNNIQDIEIFKQSMSVMLQVWLGQRFEPLKWKWNQDPPARIEPKVESVSVENPTVLTTMINENPTVLTAMIHELKERVSGETPTDIVAGEGSWTN